MLTTIFRTLIPSWRFFDQTGSICCVQFRTSTFEKWQELLPSEPRNFQNFLLNPQGNLRLTYKSQIERLAEERQSLDLKDFTASVTYRLIETLVQQGSKSSTYQFRISVLNPSQSLKPEVIYTSEMKS